jgi:hypothetical protein
MEDQEGRVSGHQDRWQSAGECRRPLIATSRVRTSENSIHSRLGHQCGAQNPPHRRHTASGIFIGYLFPQTRET